MEHLVLTWADEVRTTPLRVNLFDPRPRRHAHAPPGAAGRGPPPAEARGGRAELAALCLPGETRHGALVSFNPAI